MLDPHAFTISKVDRDEEDGTYIISTIFGSPGTKLALLAKCLVDNYSNPIAVTNLTKLGDLIKVGLCPTVSRRLIRLDAYGNDITKNDSFVSNGEECLGFRVSYEVINYACTAWSQVKYETNWTNMPREMTVGMGNLFKSVYTYPIAVGTMKTTYSLQAWKDLLKLYNNAIQTNHFAYDSETGITFEFSDLLYHFVYITDSQEWYYFMAVEFEAEKLRKL